MTSFVEIYDLAMLTIEDYRLNALAKKDEQAFKTYLRGKLTSGVSEFMGCLTSLDTTVVDVEYYFVNDLSSKEKSIIAKTIVYKWFLQLHQDVVALRPHLTVKEFKQTDVNNGIKQRSEYLDKLKEDIHFDITQYQLENLSRLTYFGGE
jgi:hypothetical protein